MSKKVKCKKCGMITDNHYVVDIVERSKKLKLPKITHVENNCNGEFEIYKGGK